MPLPQAAIRNIPKNIPQYETLKGVQSFYDDTKACVRTESGNSEWFSVKVGQGCVIPPWLVNVYKDGLVREANMI